MPVYIRSLYASILKKKYVSIRFSVFGYVCGAVYDIICPV